MNKSELNMIAFRLYPNSPGDNFWQRYRKNEKRQLMVSKVMLFCRLRNIDTISLNEIEEIMLSVKYSFN